MPKASCVICRKTWTSEKISLYHVPLDKERRELWNLACEIKLNTSARLCSIHFLETDFTGVKKRKQSVDSAPKRRRLKHNAVPTRFLKGPTEENSLQQTKDDFVQDAEGCDATIDFINEKLYDDDPTSLPAEVAIRSPAEVSYLDVSHVLPMTSKLEPVAVAKTSCSVQIGSPDTYTCGIVVVTNDLMIYSLNCSFCNEEFPLWCWCQFLCHMREFHQQMGEQQRSHIAEQCLLDATDKAYTSVAEEESGREKNVEIESFENLEALETPLEEASTAEYKEAFRDDTTRTSFTHKDFSNEQTMHNQEEPVEDEAISFGRTDSAIVMDFLDIFKANPALWDIREHSLTAYDKAVAEVTKKLNKKWHLNKTTTAVARSLQNVMEWYRRLLNGQDNNTDSVGQKYSKYFEKCAEFLSSLEISKPPLCCDKCDSVFHNETHLQVHKFREHQIGALPYKCRLCEAQFECSEALKAHKKTHPKQHNYACKECGKTFLYEYMLGKHKSIHEAKHCTCDVCGKRFTHSKYVRPHKLSVHGPMQYKCRECPKVFRNTTRLKYHMKFHRDERDYICDQCGKVFMRQKNFEEHKRIVHDYMAYQCLICDRQYLSYSGLCSHRKQAHFVLEGTIEELQARIKEPFAKHTYVVVPGTNVRSLACDMCDKTYRYHGGLSTHKIKAHGFVQPSKRRRKE